MSIDLCVHPVLVMDSLHNILSVLQVTENKSSIFYVDRSWTIAADSDPVNKMGFVLGPDQLQANLSKTAVDTGYG